MATIASALPNLDHDIITGLNPWFAGDMQKKLAPPISYRATRLEAFGRTTPKAKVGGDLADLIATERDVVAYIADVSGHGFRAATLAAVLKASVRYGRRLSQPLPALLDHINAVLPAVKEESMFATLAALRFDSSNELEYISAGHLPLLHYHWSDESVTRYAMDQFPLGLFDHETYASRQISYEPGDIFALVTDGIAEAGEDCDASFGLDGLERILCNLAASSLAEISEAVQSDAARRGMQHDDQTVLLVRALPGTAKNL
jgi:phosphoserine phosphatase RsbU/P